MLEAFSQLRRVLSKRNMSVPELHRRILEHGMNVNLKSLYRLNRQDPLERLDLRVAGAICEVCKVPLSDLIRFEAHHGKLLRFSAAKQKRLDALMEKNNQGRISKAEKQELSELATEAEEMALTNARMLAEQQRTLTER